MNEKLLDDVLDMDLSAGADAETRELILMISTSDALSSD